LPFVPVPAGNSGSAEGHGGPARCTEHAPMHFPRPPAEPMHASFGFPPPPRAEVSARHDARQRSFSYDELTRLGHR
jgi:hypothetical protein